MTYFLKTSDGVWISAHGDADRYFPAEHAHQLFGAARQPKVLWLEPGFGHAENAATPDLLHRIGRWISCCPT